MKGTCHISIQGANFRDEEHDINNQIPGTCTSTSTSTIVYSEKKFGFLGKILHR